MKKGKKSSRKATALSGMAASLPFHLALLGLLLVLLLNTYYTVASRKLDYAINRAIREQGKLTASIESLRLEVARLEAIPSVLELLNKQGLPLQPSKLPAVPILVRGETETLIQDRERSRQ